MKISKIWIYIGLVFIAATVLLITDFLGAGQWVSSVLGTNFLGLVRDGVKDDNSAIKDFVKRKKNETKAYSDSELASAIDKAITERSKRDGDI